MQQKQKKIHAYFVVDYVLHCAHININYLDYPDLLGIVLEEHRLQDHVARALLGPIHAPVLPVLGVGAPRDIGLLLLPELVQAVVPSDTRGVLADWSGVPSGSRVGGGKCHYCCFVISGWGLKDGKM